MNVKLTTLGSWGAYPAALSATSGYLLEAGGKRILLDCGSGVLSRLQQYIALEQLDAVVLSHYHTDHIADVYCLQYAIMILSQLGEREAPLDIYAPAVNEELYASLTYGEYCRAQPISSSEPLEIEGIVFKFADNIHPVPCLSMRMEYDGRTLVYTADTEWSDNVAELSRGADLLLCECSLYNEQYGQIGGHLTAGEAGRLAGEAGAGQLILTHLPHYGDHHQLVKQAEQSFTGPVALTYTGDRFDI